jgi:hypothetical protein
VLLATASCGGDEATGSSGGHTAYCKPCTHTSDCAAGNECRTVLGSLAVCAKASDSQCCDGSDCYDLQGSGGSAGNGIIGAGGKAGKGGSGSGGTAGGSATASANFGRACVKDTDCGSSGLTCVTSTGISGDGPPHGLCTMACSTQQQCMDIKSDSYCVPFTDTDAYCVAACTEGDAVKCNERDDMTCTAVGEIPGSVACETIDDCDPGELCDSDLSTCAQIVTGCMPLCGGDYDCTPDQFCDFTTGLCTSTLPSGLPLGSSCTEPTGNQTDACNGFCLTKTQDATKGECSAYCSLTSDWSGCGWNGHGAAENACLYGTILSADEPALGDLGICTKLCDCNADCSAPGDYCLDDTGGGIMNVWGRAGYCRPLIDPETSQDSISSCPPGHTGGSGGENAGGSGAMSEAGAGAGGQGGS